MNTYLAVTRTIIMLGTLLVGAMAWKVYGPPPEQLAPIVNRVVELASQTFGHEDDESKAFAVPTESLALTEAPTFPMPSSAPLRLDPEVAPAAYSQGAKANVSAPAASTDELLERLRLLGAVDAELKPWGGSGQTYRCVCRVASSENPTLERHFDAIAADAQSAVEQVESEIERWRKRSAI
jgi:hypothetical protein